MFTIIKQYVYAFIAMIGAFLMGFALYQKKRADRKDEKIDSLESEMQANDINNEVKNFEAINKTKAEYTQRKTDEAFDELDHKLNGNSTY